MKKKSVEYSLKAEKKDFPIEKISTPLDAYNYAKKFYHDDILIYESSFIILMNRVFNTIGYAKISQGGVAGTVVDVKIIAKYAIDSLASAVVLVHNHPSERLIPSTEDDKLTTKLNEALQLLDIRLMDHLIISDNAFYSYCDEGKL